LKFVRKIVETHIWIALAGLSFFISGFVLLDGDIANIPLYYYSLIFLATLFAYRLSTGPSSLASLPYPALFSNSPQRKGKKYWAYPFTGPSYLFFGY
jgi:hypothetical protein